MRIFLLDASVWDPVLAALRAVRLTDARIKTVWEGALYEQLLARPPSVRVEMPWDGDFTGGSRTSVDEIEILLPAEFDWLSRLDWAESRLTIRMAEDGAPDAALVDYGQFIIARMDADERMLRLVCKDWQAELTRPFLSQYDGTGGLNGEAEDQGDYIPVGWGVVSLAPAQFIDRGSLVMRFDRGPVQQVVAVRQRGILIPVTANYPDLASLGNAFIPQGSCATCSALGLVRFRLTPSEPVTVDYLGSNAGGYVDSAPAIAQRVASLAGIAVDAASLADVSAAVPQRAGLLASQAMTPAQAFDLLLAGLRCAWAIRWDGKLVLGRLHFDEPALLEDILSVQVSGGAAPSWEHKLGFARNWRPLSAGEVAEGITVADVEGLTDLLPDDQLSDDFSGYAQPVDVFGKTWVLREGFGSQQLVYGVPGATAGTVLQIGELDGNDELWFAMRASIPFDPTALYEISARIYTAAGTAGRVFVGVEGRGESGAVDDLVNALGENSYAQQHYIGAVDEVPTVGWHEYRGYFRGYGPVFSAPDSSNPSGLNAAVRRIAPVVIVHYLNAAGQSQIDSVRLRRLPAAVPWTSIAGTGTPAPFATNDRGEDTRNVDYPPTHYRQNWFLRLRTEYKLRSIISAPGTATYGVLYSLAKWSDDTGGPVEQQFISETGVYYRSGTNAGGWGSWRTSFDTANRPDLSAGDLINDGAQLAPGQLLNSSIVLNADGSASFYNGAAWINLGAVNIRGLGYSGDLNATYGADWAESVNARPTELTDGTVIATRDRTQRLRTNGRALGSLLPTGNNSGVTSAVLSAPVSGLTSATITISPHTRYIFGAPVYYNGGTISGLNPSTRYYIYADDPDELGGAVVYLATTDFSTVSGANRIYFGPATTAAAGNPGGGGGGGGGDLPPPEYCVQDSMWLRPGLQARDAKVGDQLWCMDDDGNDIGLRPITGITFAEANCIAIVTRSAGVIVSATAPVWTQNRGFVRAGEVAQGDVVAVRIGNQFDAATVAGVASIGPRLVAKIHVDGVSYAAGLNHHWQVYTHNPTYKP